MQTDREVWTVVAPIFWFLAAISHMGLVCFSAGQVNDHAHAIKDSVYMSSFKKGLNSEMIDRVKRKRE